MNKNSYISQFFKWHSHHYIKRSSTEGDTIRLINADAKEVCVVKVNSSTDTFEINTRKKGVENGIHILDVRTGTGNYFKKVIIHQ